MNKMTVSNHRNRENTAFTDSEKVKVSPMTFVLFGATEDLAKRKISPALATDTFNGKVVAALRNEFGGHSTEKADQ